MKQAPGSGLTGVKTPQASCPRAPDPKLVEFVKSLARAAAREDHRRAAEAALPRPEPDGQ
jgi:hypothetical protein